MFFGLWLAVGTPLLSCIEGRVCTNKTANDLNPHLAPFGNSAVRHSVDRVEG